MEKSALLRKALIFALASVLVVSVLALAGCASSSGSSSSASASSSASSASSSSASSSSSSASPSDVPMYTVPNVISLTQADADKAIYASGMLVGVVTTEPSDTVPAGAVISQNPGPLTAAPANTKVDLVVSTGKPEAKDVQVPDLRGLTQEDAEKALSAVGLVGVPSNPEETDEVGPGRVFKQSIEAGKTVKEGTNVAFTVALSPKMSTVPNVVGKTTDEAKKAITDLDLGFDTTSAYDESVPEGRVISQSIAPGRQVKAGTKVSVVISLGPKPVDNVKVPDVVTFSWSDAQTALQSAGLACRYTGDPAGVVVAQDVAPGTMVAPNTLVTVTLASPAKMVEVPDLIGMTLTSAEEATDNLNLTLSISGGPAGIVVEQWPAAGTEVEERSLVYITVEPVVAWEPAPSAEAAIASAEIEFFDVQDEIYAGDDTFSNPRFSFATHAVQALYENPASVICIRKGVGEYAVSLTERDVSTFEVTWIQNHKGLEITCYGHEQDAATVIEWHVDDMTYMLTFQGLGGAEMSLTPDEVASVVSGIQ